jgi:hypothetical protein
MNKSEFSRGMESVENRVLHTHTHINIYEGEERETERERDRDRERERDSEREEIPDALWRFNDISST